MNITHFWALCPKKMFQTVPDTSSYVKVRQHRHYEQVMSEETRLELLNCLFPLPSFIDDWGKWLVKTRFSGFTSRHIWLKMDDTVWRTFSLTNDLIGLQHIWERVHCLSSLVLNLIWPLNEGTGHLWPSQMLLIAHYCIWRGAFSLSLLTWS